MFPQPSGVHHIESDGRSSLRDLQAVPSLDEAVALFHAGRYRASMDAALLCIKDGYDGERATLLKARIALRAYDPATIVSDLLDAQQNFESDSNRIEASILVAVAFARLGDFRSAERRFAAIRAWDIPRELRWEAAHLEATALWMAGRHDEAEDRLLAQQPPEDDRIGRARFVELRSWIAARRGHPLEQVRLLLQAVEVLAGPDYIDVGLLAGILRTLATLNRELHVPELNQTLVDLDANLPWTEELRVDRFWIKSTLAWSLCLRGLWMPAIRLAQQATALAEGPAWHVQSLLDRAYLKRNAGDLSSGQADLEEALELIDSVDWASSRDEERLCLATAAGLYAEIDPTRAHHLLMEFRRHAGSFDVRMGVRSDRRLDAFLNQHAGAVFAAIGDEASAVEAYQTAYSIFKDVQHHWRAALVALNLFRITGERAWHALAEENIRDYPESWIAADVRLAAPFAELTPREREVLQAMMEGLDTKMTSERFGLQPTTTRLYRQRVFQAFKVSSQLELMRVTRGRRFVVNS